MERIANAKLDLLAEDPDNLVLKYKDREPLDPRDVLPLHQVRSYVLELWGEVRDVRVNKLRVSIQDATMTKLECKKLRWWLLTKSKNVERWSRFSETHPLMFDRCVGGDTTQQEIDALLHMIHLKQESMLGHTKDKDASKQLEEYMWKTFSMSKEAYTTKYGEHVEYAAPSSSSSTPTP